MDFDDKKELQLAKEKMEERLKNMRISNSLSTQGFVREKIAQEVKTHHSTTTAAVHRSKEGVSSSQSFSWMSSQLASTFEQRMDAMNKSALSSFGSSSIGLPHSQSSSGGISLTKTECFSRSGSEDKFGVFQNFKAFSQNNGENKMFTHDFGKLPSPLNSRFGFLNFQPLAWKNKFSEDVFNSPSFHINASQNVTFESCNAGIR